MSQRSSVSDATARTTVSSEPAPPPDVVAFIRYCHRRGGANWPELYDEMCAVAARKEFNGWDHDELAARGLAFSLFEMPRLAAWCRTVLAAMPPEPDRSPGARSAPADAHAAPA
jgi:hypothetical protein